MVIQFAMKHRIGSPPAREGLMLYMARVDCYLISGSEISIDLDASLMEELVDIQHAFIRRLLGINSRSMLAVLFSETGLMPIRMRQVLLALARLRYMVQLGDNGRCSTWWTCLLQGKRAGRGISRLCSDPCRRLSASPRLDICALQPSLLSLMTLILIIRTKSPCRSRLSTTGSRLQGNFNICNCQECKCGVVSLWAAVLRLIRLHKARVACGMWTW